MKIVYIAGCTHSGTTLLNRVLGAHSRVVTLGSVKNLRKELPGPKPCRCGAPSPLECPFWMAVDTGLREAGRRLEGLDTMADDPATFGADNRALFEAVARVSGAEVIVDSSRSGGRLRRLQAVPGLEVLPVHLHKAPGRQAWSWVRKGHGLPFVMKEFWLTHLKAAAACRGNPASRTLAYERFCADPGTVLEGLFAWMGLEHEPGVLHAWGQAPIHVLGGNHMKRSDRSDIALDDGYRTRLHAWTRWTVAATCGPLSLYLGRRGDL